jgi:tRNA (guanine26-N2/guanine27-N2)-dimethyltransferase
MYGGPLHNVEFIKRILAQLKEVDRETYPTMDRIEGMLHTAMEEITFGVENGKKNQEPEQLDPLIPKADPAEVDHHPFFIIPSSISKIVHCSAPGIAPLRGALRHAGFRVTMSHCKPGSVKTDASWKDVWHVILEWVRQKAPLKKELKKGTAGRAIMSKKLIFPAPAKIHDEPAETNKTAEQANSTEDVVMEDARPSNDEKDVVEKAKGDRPSYLGVDFEVKFDATLGRDRDRGKYVRYQLAPRENWGPMSRAK